MQLIAGLGNPGSQYARNRHNIGFMVADEIVRRHNFGPWRSKFQAQISEGTLAGEKVAVMKPQTFMNESGRSVLAFCSFYKLTPDDIIVLHDELDLAPGKVRVKTGGGHGGHNGLRSITSHIGDGYHRLRLGIGHPGDKQRVNSHVLGDFAKADTDWLEPFIDALSEPIDLLVKGERSNYANKVHLTLQDGAKPAKSKAKTSAKPIQEKASTSGSKSDDPDSKELKPKSALAEGLANFFKR